MPILGGVPTPVAATAPHLSYDGGPVVSSIKLVHVLYGAGSYAPEISGTTAGAFFQALTNSSFIDWLSEYNTDTQGGTQRIGRGSFASQLTITPSTGGSPDAKGLIYSYQIEKELGDQLTAGKLPAPDANTLYVLSFPKGVKISQGFLFGSSCTQGGFCAYHDSFNQGGQSVFFAVLPDMSIGSGCEAPFCGSNPVPFNNWSAVASHEIAETITDPSVGDYRFAWRDPVNGEIGDICVSQQGTFVGPDGVTYTGQKLWSNQMNACIIGK
jgi:hypothetical protein